MVMTMKMGKYLQSVLLSVTSIAVVLPIARAEDSATLMAAEARGTIVGIVANAAKVPIGGVTVTAARAGGGIRSTVSGSDGIYSFADVPPGSWSLTITVDGSPDVVVPNVDVVASKATRHDIVMNAVAAKAPAPTVAALAPVAAPAAAATIPEACLLYTSRCV